MRVRVERLAALGQQRADRLALAASSSSARSIRATSDTTGAYTLSPWPKPRPLRAHRAAPRRRAAPSCGEAIVRLLEQYDVDTVFGIPGVHTLEIYRGLAASAIRHVSPRHEQGAAFMADGYARVAGKPGVCVADHGRRAHERRHADRRAPTTTRSRCSSSRARPPAPTTAAGTARSTTCPTSARSWPRSRPSRSTCAIRPTCPRRSRARSRSSSRAGRARCTSASRSTCSTCPRPRGSACRRAARRRVADAALVERAVELLAGAERPMLLLGGGAVAAGAEATAIAERLGAPVGMTVNAKGVLPDSHPLQRRHEPHAAARARRVHRRRRRARRRHRVLRDRLLLRAEARPPPTSRAR